MNEQECEGTLIQSLSKVVERRWQAEAVRHGDGSLSYGELWRRSGALADVLKREGLAPQDRIALLMDNCPEYVVAYYGVLRAGGAVVALNTAAKHRDLLNWIDHSGAAWLIADASHPEFERVRCRLPARVGLIVVGGDRGAPVGGALSWHEVTEHGDGVFSAAPIEDPASHLAAIIYTSGTTGRPKGVMLSHRNLCMNMRSIQEYLKLGPDDRLLNVLPFYYSYGNSVLHTHLMVGGSVVLENSMAYPRRILEQAQAQRVTGFSGVPSTFNLLLSRTRPSDYDLASLRYLTQAGGPMAPAVIKRIRSELPHARLFVMYGQTEATARLTYLPPERLEEKLGSIGVAIPRVEIEVRDEAGRVAAAGEQGEICVRGDNVMMGYWRDPEATAAVLKDGWLHTGDIAYRDEEGFLYIVGRSSEMIKSGAHRISPKEIEEVVQELEGVEEVAVVGVPDELLGQVIKAVIVRSPGAGLEVREVLRHCKENLAAYKIPRKVEFVDRLPRTASGKIRRFMLVEDREEGE